MTPFNRFGCLPPGSVQPRIDVASYGNGAGHRFGVRLVVVADDCVRGHTGSTQGAAEEGFRTGAVPLVP
jgi:hypothetical protein